MDCPNCESQVSAGALFCSHCGHQLSQPEPAPAASKRRGLIALVIYALVVTLILVAAWFILRPLLAPGGESDPAEATADNTAVAAVSETPTPTQTPSPTQEVTLPTTQPASAPPTKTPRPSKTPTPTPSTTPTPTPTPTFTPEPLGKRVAIEEFDVIYDAFAAGSFDPDSSQWNLNEDRTDRVSLNGRNVLLVQGNAYWEGFHVRRQGFTVQPGGGVFFRFTLADSDHAGRFGLRPEGGGFIGLIFHLGSLYPDYNIGNRDIGINSVSVGQQINIWYLAQMSIDLEGRITWRVWQETASGGYIKLIDQTLDSPTTNDFFKNKSYQFYVQAGTLADNSILYLSDYQEGFIGPD